MLWFLSAEQIKHQLWFSLNETKLTQLRARCMTPF